jgi:hypothetical protein
MKAKLLLASMTLLTDFENPFTKPLPRPCMQQRFDPENASRKPPVILKIDRKPVNPSSNPFQRLHSSDLEFVSVFKYAIRNFPFIFFNKKTT